MDQITVSTTTPALPSCTPPQQLYCPSDGGACTCVQIGPPPQACQVTISYPPVGAPLDPQITVTPAGCSAASVELALAIALTKCLQLACGAP